MKMVTLTLRAEDAEPILRQAADTAARYGAYLDHITRRTVGSPALYLSKTSFDDFRKEWRAKFLAAKRIVEAFGVEHEPTSEAETLTVWIGMKNEKRRPLKVAGLAMVEVSGGEHDYDNTRPEYRRDVHAQACRYAADRVVRRWQGR